MKLCRHFYRRRRRQRRYDDKVVNNVENDDVVIKSHKKLRGEKVALKKICQID